MARKINITEEQAIQIYKETKDKKILNLIKEYYAIRRKDLEDKISGNLIQSAVHWLMIAYNDQTLYYEDLRNYWRNELSTFLLNSTKFNIKGGNLQNAVVAIAEKLRLADKRILLDLFKKKLEIEIRNNGLIYFDEDAMNYYINLFCSKENYSNFINCLVESSKNVGNEYIQEEIISDYVNSLPPNY